MKIKVSNLIPGKFLAQKVGEGFKTFLIEATSQKELEEKLKETFKAEKIEILKSPIVREPEDKK